MPSAPKMKGDSDTQQESHPLGTKGAGLALEHPCFRGPSLHPIKCVEARFPLHTLDRQLLSGLHDTKAIVPTCAQRQGQIFLSFIFNK